MIRRIKLTIFPTLAFACAAGPRHRMEPPPAVAPASLQLERKDGEPGQDLRAPVDVPVAQPFSRIRELVAARRSTPPSVLRGALYDAVRALEREVHASAHAGLKRPPQCTGHFTNSLRARFIGNGDLVLIRCNDATQLYSRSLGRIATWDDASLAYEVVEAALPGVQLRQVAPSWPNGLVPCLPDDEMRVDDGLDFLEVATAVAGGTRRSVSLQSLRPPRLFKESSTVSVWCIPTKPALRALLWRSEFDALRYLDIVRKTDGGRIARTEGDSLRVLTDGRVALLGEPLVWVDAEKGRARNGAAHVRVDDVSPDGRLHLELETITEDNMSHPRFPFVYDPSARRRSAVGEYVSPSSAPAAQMVPPMESPDELLQRMRGLTWPSVVARDPACPNTGLMAGRGVLCDHPSGRVRDRSFSPSSEVACFWTDQEHAADGLETATLRCLDPEGPTSAPDPWDPALVCRVGPYVLPFGACEALLSSKRAGTPSTARK